MAVAIRFRRGGRRNRPFYRIVVADSRSPRDGRFIEAIGYYDPMPKPHKVEINRERLMHWLLLGARPSQSVKSILAGNGIWKEIAQEMTENKMTSKSEIENSIEAKTESQADVVAHDEQGG